jgi:hypothetical protein
VRAVGLVAGHELLAREVLCRLIAAAGTNAQ